MPKIQSGKHIHLTMFGEGLKWGEMLIGSRIEHSTLDCTLVGVDRLCGDFIYVTNHGMHKHCYSKSINIQMGELKFDPFVAMKHQIALCWSDERFIDGHTLYDGKWTYGVIDEIKYREGKPYFYVDGNEYEEEDIILPDEFLPEGVTIE
jgi:hypothetical protein